MSTMHEPDGLIAPRHEELQLVAALRRGEASALEAAFRRYGERLYRFTVRLTRDRELAAELTQQAWISLARSRATLAPDTSLLPWLFTVVRNAHVSHRRWQALDLSRLGELAQRALGGGPRSLTPLEALAGSRLERALERAVAELPPALREVVLLVCVEQLEPSEAARVLGLSPEAVRQRLSRGRARLAQALEEEDAR